MSEAPKSLHICTKTAVASNFTQGLLFGSPKASDTLGTVEYIRADAAADEIERLREALYHADEGAKYQHLYDETKYA